jgi:hypothetical protein
MSFSKKIQLHLQVLLLFKNIGYNVFKMILGEKILKGIKCAKVKILCQGLHMTRVLFFVGL